MTEKTHNLSSAGSASATCAHENTTAHLEYVKCNGCGSVRADAAWGIASFKWFKSLDEAKFYRDNGRLPDPLTGTAAQSSQVTDDELFDLATKAWESQTSSVWYTDAIQAVIDAVRERTAAQPPAAPVETGDGARNAHSTLWGMIGAIYDGLDFEDRAWVDREWAKMRGYILPPDNSVTLSRSSAATESLAPEAMAHMLGIAVSKAEHFLKTFRVSALRPEPWSCAARKQALPEPAECNWPVCGCDPYADKVIAALEESGSLNVPQSSGVWQPIETAPKKRSAGHVRLFGDGEGIHLCEYIGIWSPGEEAWREVYSNRHVQPTHWMPCNPPTPALSRPK